MRFTSPILAMAATAALVLSGCGKSSGLSGFNPPASTTTTSPAPSTSTSDSGNFPTPEPSDLATPTPEPSFEGKAADFKLGVKILRKKCFGSAGCNITYRITPEYVGLAELPDTGTIEVTYVVKGLEDGDAVNTFTIEGGNASFESEENGSVPSSKTKLTAAATDVTYQP